MTRFVLVLDLSGIVLGLAGVVTVLCVLVTILAVLVFVALRRIGQLELLVEDDDPGEAAGFPQEHTRAPLRVVAGGRTRGADA